MSTTKSLWHRLIDSAMDPGAVPEAYGEYLLSLLSEPLWSLECPGGSRIHWRSAPEAHKHAALTAAFASRGVYLFGTSAGVPRYWGRTTGKKQSLWKRLNGRYFHSKQSQSQVPPQFQLAVDYGPEVITRGMDGFPEAVRNKCKEWYGKTVRLDDAIDLARHGIEGIWFALGPVSDPGAVPNLETTLIRVGNAWNLSRGYPPLLNRQDT